MDSSMKLFINSMSERTMCHPKTSSTAKHNDTHTCPLFLCKTHK